VHIVPNGYLHRLSVRRIISEDIIVGIRKNQGMKNRPKKVWAVEPIGYFGLAPAIRRRISG